jgi:hypothetical protein
MRCTIRQLNKDRPSQEDYRAAYMRRRDIVDRMPVGFEARDFTALNGAARRWPTHVEHAIYRLIQMIQAGGVENVQQSPFKAAPGYMAIRL